ncbi:MAG: SIMPL domain-containing protein [Pseudomonadota bacterium]
MREVSIGGALVAVGLTLCGFLVGGGIRGIRNPERSVQVRGLAERMVKSTDSAWKLEYSVTGAEPSLLNNELARTQGEIHKFLIGCGFDESEIQKNPVVIHDSKVDQYQQKKDAPRYTGRGSFVVGSKKVDLVTSSAEKTYKLLESGVVIQQSSVSYYFSDLNSIKPEMLKEATASAREAADSFATNSSSRLGKIKSASQGLFSIGAPFSEYDSASSIQKKIRVVTEVSYTLE